jgi:hypothetical protein
MIFKREVMIARKLMRAAQCLTLHAIRAVYFFPGLNSLDLKKRLVWISGRA